MKSKDIKIQAKINFCSELFKEICEKYSYKFSGYTEEQKCRDFFFLGYNIREKMFRDAAPITKEQELSAALDETQRN